MYRRRHVLASIVTIALGAGCLDAFPVDEFSTGSGEPDDPSGLSIGDSAPVTDHATAAPTSLHVADEIVFATYYDGEDIVWTPAAGDHYLLVEVRMGITDAGDDEHAPYPDLFDLRVRADGQAFTPIPRPDDTNVITEPIEGGYFHSGSKGTEGSGTIDWVAFEIPESADEGDVALLFERESDGVEFVWTAEE